MQHDETTVPSDPLAENQALRSRIAVLIEQAEHNYALLGRHQAFDLELIAAGSFIELIGSIFHTLPIVSDLDSVTLSLLDEGDDIHTVMERLGVDFDALPDLILVGARHELGWPGSAAQNAAMPGVPAAGGSAPGSAKPGGAAPALLMRGAAVPERVMPGAVAPERAMPASAAPEDPGPSGAAPVGPASGGPAPGGATPGAPTPCAPTPGAPAPGALKPLLGPFDAALHGDLFPTVQGLASVALVPLLRHQRLIGSLNLGSRDPARFTPQLGTDFIEHMGSIIAICLENVISNEMLKYIGLTDALTGVYNRRYIDRRVLEEIARARRQDYRIACLFIDIDHFKRINDTLGHQCGDEVLREVAQRVRGELRLSDALARFGGEEFIALLIDTDLDNAARVAERIRAAIAGRPFLCGGATLALTISLGVSELDRSNDELTVEQAAQRMVGRADAALYQAKEGGRNRVVGAPPA